MRNLKLLRKQTGETQSDIAHLLGVDRTTYAKYESGATEPSFDTIKKLAKHFDVSTGYLMDEIGASRTRKNEVRIPVFRSVAAGPPIEAIEDIVNYIEIDSSFVEWGECFGLVIEGQSMEPWICNGDVVVVRRQEYARNGDTAIVLIDGSEATCKNIKQDSSGLWLLAYNPAYKPMHFSAEEVAAGKVQIIGKVVELRRKF